MNLMRKISKKLAEVKYIREILENPADLSEFRERPTPRLITGLVLMGFSYIIGWPAVAALGILAGWLREPLIAVIGCPTIYGLSCVVFLVGAWLAQGLEPAHACALAVYLHGAAGDLAADDVGEVAMTAGDLLPQIGDAVLELTARQRRERVTP